MTSLVRLHAREVLDSRGNPTVEVEAHGTGGVVGRAIVPSGASTGRHEAWELRDGDPAWHGGKGVRRVVARINTEVAPALAGYALDDQEALDAALIQLDGTPRKARLGANGILGVSLAVAHAAAATRGEPLYAHLHRLWRNRLGPDDAPDVGAVLPLPMVNMISGGLHAGGQIDLQDVLFVPIGATCYADALELTTRVYRALKRALKAHGEESDLVGDEGGFGPKLTSDAQAIERVLEAMESAGVTPGESGAIALDVAATHCFDPDSQTYRLGGAALDAAGMVDRLESWVNAYPIVSIEDGLAEDDWDGWALLTRRLGGRAQLIGDDLFCTQTDRIQTGTDRGAANAVLIKLNQVGTLSETLDALLLARRHGLRAIISARSGETEDATIADLAVATAAGQIKIGSVARSERLAKYNRLSRIEEALGGAEAPYAGRAALAR